MFVKFVEMLGAKLLINLNTESDFDIRVDSEFIRIL